MKDCIAVLVVLRKLGAACMFYLMFISQISNKQLKLRDVTGKFRVTHMHLSRGYVHSRQVCESNALL